MKKRIWGLLVLIVLFSFGMNTYAKDTLENEAESTSIVPFEKLQTLFPDIPIKEDGFVEGYENNQLSVYSSDKKILDGMISSPVESYSVQYNGGLCTLNIYNNGQYGVVGYEKLDNVDRAGAGSEVYGSKYRSYYDLGGVGFFYTYTIYSSGSYSQFHNLSYPTGLLVDVNPYWNCTPGATGYVRQTQTASLPAEAYGWGYFSYMGGSGVGYSLCNCRISLHSFCSR